MPINSVHQWIRGILDGLVIPGNAGTLDCFITPPDPREEPPPAIYIWAARAPEKRQATSRAKIPNSPVNFSGWKTMDHTVTGYVTWFGEDSDDQADVTFPAVVDAIMAALRSSDPNAFVTDPLSGIESYLVDTGERMTYDLSPMKSTLSQRFLRYDAVITMEILEVFQA
jgi:hypothetical protein